MGNFCSGFPHHKPNRRLTISSSQRRPVTVDRDAETEILDELTTVSQDRTTASRPHLLTFCYPTDTPLHIRGKLPKHRLHKRMNQPVLIGRGVDADVMLNEEHIPRLFAQVLCRSGGHHDVESKWFLKNMTEKKLLYVSCNNVKRCLKFGEEAELQDGCELNLDVLTLLIKIDEGDVCSSKQGFEVQVCPMENDSSDSSFREAAHTCSRQASGRSTTTHTSVASAAPARGRQGSASAKGGVQSPGPDPAAHYADPAAVVQHLVHYCHNVFPPGSPGSTCCLHHHPYGCPQQQHQQCYACHQSGTMSPTVRKHSNQETVSPTTHLASGYAPGMSYFPREETCAGASVAPMMPQGPFEAANRGELPAAGLPFPRELLSGQPSGDVRLEQMYCAPEVVTRHGYGMPELYGMVPNTTFTYGPSAFHPQLHPLQHPQPVFGRYAGIQPEGASQQGFVNVLRRSRSMFTRQYKRPEQLQRRSSCDGAQLTAQLVAQPESAQMCAQHGSSDPNISSLALHETAYKVYHAPSQDIASQSTQIDSLKFGSAALAAVSPDTTAGSLYTSAHMPCQNADPWDAVDAAQKPAPVGHPSMPLPPQVRADGMTSGRHPVESISDVLPSTAGFSSSSSTSEEDRPWKNAATHRIHYSLRQPQENDERHADEKYVQHQHKLHA